jgi:hypothetical protein
MIHTCIRGVFSLAKNSIGFGTTPFVPIIVAIEPLEICEILGKMKRENNKNF